MGIAEMGSTVPDHPPAATFLTPATRPPPRIFFRMWPDAPAILEAKRASSSSKEVSISTRVAGKRDRIARHASMADDPGMRASMTTTAGASSSTASRADEASDASPTTSISGSDSSSRQTPARTRAWSSQTSTRILLDICETETVVLSNFVGIELSAISADLHLPDPAFSCWRDMPVVELVAEVRVDTHHPVECGDGVLNDLDVTPTVNASPKADHSTIDADSHSIRIDAQPTGQDAVHDVAVVDETGSMVGIASRGDLVGA